jgi:hypothetical protein
VSWEQAGVCVFKWRNGSVASVFHLTTPSKQMPRNGFGSRTSPSATRAWKTLSYVKKNA